MNDELRTPDSQLPDAARYLNQPDSADAVRDRLLNNSKTWSETACSTIQKVEDIKHYKNNVIDGTACSITQKIEV
ncbi:MAG: hypothetical protein AB1757_20330 [Acidobacteriota bacterium]